MPTTELAASDVGADGINIVDLMILCKLAPSKGEARRLIQQGGVTADGEKVAAPTVMISAEALKNGVKLRKGKKIYHKAILA